MPSFAAAGWATLMRRVARDETRDGKLELLAPPSCDDHDHDGARVTERAYDEQVSRPLDEPEHELALGDQFHPRLRSVADAIGIRTSLPRGAPSVQTAT